MSRSRHARSRALSGGYDEGFTLVEILLAMFLAGVVMAVIAGVLVSSLKTVAQARQRQTATALATQSLERLRALPYDSVTGSDAVNYPLTPGLLNTTTTVAGTTFAAAAVLPGVSETLVINQYSGKRSSTAMDGVTYVMQTYVTKAAVTAAGEQAFNLTSLVSWTSTVYPATRTTVQRSTTFSPSGCLSTAQHPFAAPCQAYFTATAGLSAARFSVTNADSSTSDIPGFIGGRLVELDLPVLSANLQIEQTASGGASATTSGTRSVPGAAGGLGAKVAAASVDSNPSSTPAQDQTATAPGQTSSPPVGLTDAVAGILSAQPTSNDTASSTAAIAAGTCTDGSKLARLLATGLAGQLRPCASATAQQLTTAKGNITYTPPSGSGVAVLTLGAAPSPSRVVAALLATGNPGIACFAGTGASPPGCAHSSGYRSTGDLVVGAPTTGAGTLDSRGLFSVTGLEETAVAERGVGARAPTLTRTGTLTVWTTDPVSHLDGYKVVNLADYSTQAVSPQLPSQTWTIPAVTTTYAGGLTVTATGSVTVQRPQITVTGPADCMAVACVAQVSGAGGLRAVTIFTVSSGGVQLTQFVLVSDLGGPSAQSSYKAAPNA